jgi:hypothetical protein
MDEHILIKPHFLNTKPRTNKGLANTELDILERIRLGGESQYITRTLFTNQVINANSNAVSQVLDNKRNGDYILNLMGNLATNSGNAGKTNQQVIIQTSIDGTNFLDKNIPVNMFVDSTNTPIVNDEFRLRNRFIRVKYVNGDNTTRTVSMTAELNIAGITNMENN